jgi:hypothetical protein
MTGAALTKRCVDVAPTADTDRTLKEISIQLNNNVGSGYEVVTHKGKYEIKPSKKRRHERVPSASPSGARGIVTAAI